ncbi:MAG TPA: peptide chain release factor 2 [Candidatus Dormibacteraeota bacterium]
MDAEFSPKELLDRVLQLKEHLDLARKEARAAELESLLAQPGVWDDSQRATRLAKEMAGLRQEVDAWDHMGRRARDLVELAQLAAEDDELGPAVDEELKAVRQELGQRELDLLFADPYASHAAVVSISAGQGGIEAQDWVEMLLRMYLKWAQRRGYAAEVLEASPGEEAGLKSTTFTIAGSRAYGYLRSEHGVHRLVRISPFDQQHRRHTTFALVEVMPELEESEEEEIQIDPEELRIETYRSTGAGGQHVNKTESAVRITHLPTGTVVTCQNERSQIQNRETAMKILRSRLFQRRRQEEAEKRNELRGELMPAGFGSQIRSYVMQPYTMVKDLRTEVEVGDVQSVLDGDLDQFMEAWLRWRLTQESS